MFVRIVTTSPLRNPIPYSLCVSTSICVEAQLLVPLTRKFRNCQRDHRFSEHLHVVQRDANLVELRCELVRGRVRISGGPEWFTVVRITVTVEALFLAIIHDRDTTIHCKSLFLKRMQQVVAYPSDIQLYTMALYSDWGSTDRLPQRGTS